MQTIRDMLERYEKRAQAEAAEHGTRLSYIVIDLSSCDSRPTLPIYCHVNALPMTRSSFVDLHLLLRSLTEHEYTPCW